MSFIFDGNTETPEELRRKREMYARMLQNSQGYMANNVGEGIAQLGQAIAGRIGQGMVDRKIRGYQSKAAQLLSSLAPSYDAVPMPDPGAAPAAPVDPLMGGAGTDTLAGGTKPVSLTSYAGKMTPSEWLKYANQGAIRDKPVNENLAKAMGFLPELGVTMKVFSGGQAPKGSGGKRTGSTRHDHGNAADVFFYKDGRRLDWANKNDLPLFQEIVRRARANGVTGFGAGPGYMQPGSMHIGFGTPSVWGAGGSSRNAPQWLRAAFVANEPFAPSGGNMVATAAPQPITGAIGADTLTGGAGGVPAGPQHGISAPAQMPVAAPDTLAPAPQQIATGQGPVVQPASAPSTMRPMSMMERQRMNAANKYGDAKGGFATEQAVQSARMGQAPQSGGGNFIQSLLWGPQAASAPDMAMSTLPAAATPPTAPTGPSGRLQQLERAIYSPYFQFLDAPQQKFIVDQYQYEQERAANQPDPLDVRKRELEIQRLERDLQPDQGFVPLSPEEKRKIGIPENIPAMKGPDGRIEIIKEAIPQQPKPGYRQISPDEAQRMGLPPGNYQQSPDGKIESIGKSGVSVTNVIGGSEKFDEEFAKGDAKVLGEVYNAGLTAQKNIARINQLDALLQKSPTGLQGSIKQIAGELGINTEGLDSIQAAQALINSLVPEQRQPGSGPMSDRDLELFKAALPRIINQPGGNSVIINTMRAIAQYDADGAAIVQKLRAREITRTEAFEMLQNRRNPLAEFSNDQKTPPPLAEQTGTPNLGGGDYEEGDIVQNAAGQKLILKNNVWVPYNGE